MDRFFSSLPFDFFLLVLSCCCSNAVEFDDGCAFKLARRGAGRLIQCGVLPIVCRRKMISKDLPPVFFSDSLLA